MANYTYAAPGVTVTSLGPTTPILAGPTARTLLMIGTAPKGPRFPVLCRLADVINLFGDPASSGSLGYTLPYALSIAGIQRLGPGSTAPRFLVCRAGVTSGTLALQDGAAATTLTISGEGRYAGSASANLKVTVTGSGATLTIILSDGPTGNVLQIFSASQYDLTTSAKCAAAINGANQLNSAAAIASAVSATTGPPVAVALTALSAGTDGKGTVYSHASVATLLAQSLWAHADYIVPLWDGGSIASTVATHISSAVASTELRKAIVGPALGTTYSTLIGSYASTIASSRFSNIGHDGAYGRNPVTGAKGQVDGFFLAAAYAGMKASAIPAATGINAPLAGFDSLSIPTDLTGALTPSQQLALGGAANLWLKQPYGGGAILVGDALTTAPYTNNNQINPFSQMSVQDADDAILSTAVAAIAPFAGQASDGALAGISQGINSSVNGAVSALGKAAHNGVNSCNTTLDPNTSAPATIINYRSRYPYLQIAVSTGFSVG